jgi:hypothetical protein
MAPEVRGFGECVFLIIVEFVRREQVFMMRFVPVKW